MKLPLAVLADYANLSAEGKLNIMGIFNRIFANSVPTVHPQMRLVMQFQTEPADRGQTKNLEVKLLDADGRDLLSLQSSIKITQEMPLIANVPQILELNGLQFESFGDYVFHVLVNGETKSSVSFSIQQMPAQPPNQEG